MGIRKVRKNEGNYQHVKNRHVCFINNLRSTHVDFIPLLKRSAASNKGFKPETGSVLLADTRKEDQAGCIAPTLNNM